MSISVLDAQGLLTKKLIAVYREMPKATTFLSSFFKTFETMTEDVSVAVQRGSERVAVDVFRFSDGNRNSFDSSTERIIKPPLYHEYLTANEHRLYMQVVTAISQGNTTFFRELTADLAQELMMLRDKIDRAVEIQCAQILELGVVSLNTLTDIDYKRKAASLVAYNVANDFSVGTVDPSEVLGAGCKFIREKGKAQGGTYNAIMGESALIALLDNTIIKSRQLFVQASIDSIIAPEKQLDGATFHGILSCGSYKCRLWTYPEVHELSAGVQTPYINDKKVIILPLQPNFVRAYAAVPQLIGANGSVPQKGAYLVQEFFNEEKGQHKVSIKAAPIAIPVAIDQIYTIQVLA